MRRDGLEMAAKGSLVQSLDPIAAQRLGPT